MDAGALVLVFLAAWICRHDQQPQESVALVPPMATWSREDWRRFDQERLDECYRERCVTEDDLWKQDCRESGMTEEEIQWCEDYSNRKN